jgi:hypothetical protein
VIYVIIGRREKGKTTLADRMLKALSLRFVIDARRMINQRDPSIIYENYADGAREAIYEAVESGGLYNEVIYQPHEDDLQGAFNTWVVTLKAIAIEHPKRQIGILVDEASFYSLNDPAFQWLAKCTPREYVHIFITAHRPTDIPPRIRAIADHWFVFHMTERSDIEHLAEKSEAIADAASKLHDRGYVHWNDTNATMQINMNAASWFIRLNEEA